WAAQPLRKRIDTVRKFKEQVIERQETLARTLTEEVGKPIRQSRNELKGLLARLDFFVAESARALRDETVLTDAGQKLEERISHVPLGVVANISAWNYPYFVGSNVFVPALVAGNAVLYKPSEYATLTGLHIADMLHAAGVPEDVFVAALGDGAFYNTGQSCCSVERIYVHEAIHDAFVDAFVNEVKGYKVGDPEDESSYIGAITRKAQLAVLQRQVADAKKKGAKVLVGGAGLKRKGNWFAPTVLTDVDHSMAVMREESFGPIIGIQAVADDDAAVD